jgi:hypothetical protein
MVTGLCWWMVQWLFTEGFRNRLILQIPGNTTLVSIWMTFTPPKIPRKVLIRQYVLYQFSRKLLDPRQRFWQHSAFSWRSIFYIHQWTKQDAPNIHVWRVHGLLVVIQHLERAVCSGLRYGINPILCSYSIKNSLWLFNFTTILAQLLGYGNDLPTRRNLYGVLQELTIPPQTLWYSPAGTAGAPA